MQGPRQRIAAVTACLVLALGSAACGEQSQSALHPASGEASSVNNLWWFMAVLGTIVWAGVVILLLVAIFRRRASDEPTRRKEPLRMVLLGGVAMPVAILVILMGMTVATLNATTVEESDEGDLVVEVVGHRWWWEVRYPEQDIVTANEIYIPVGRSVRLELSSADVIHSLWIPRLQGKVDMIPGTNTELRIRANTAGEYRGQCAEFCGVQHANMAMFIHAVEQSEFEEWLDRRREPREQPTDPLVVEGQQVFLGSACVYCHAIEGTGATGVIGPNLTNIAGRSTLGAGTLDNNPELLAAWILNPHEFKPGNLMPPTEIDEASLRALLAYLATLE